MKISFEQGMRAVSWILALGGAWALWRSAGPLAVIGAILLIWANNVYESTR